MIHHKQHGKSELWHYFWQVLFFSLTYRFPRTQSVILSFQQTNLLLTKQLTQEILLQMMLLI